MRAVYEPWMPWFIIDKTQKNVDMGNFPRKKTKHMTLSFIYSLEGFSPYLTISVLFILLYSYVPYISDGLIF